MSLALKMRIRLVWQRFYNAYFGNLTIYQYFCRQKHC